MSVGYDPITKFKFQKQVTTKEMPKNGKLSRDDVSTAGTQSNLDILTKKFFKNLQIQLYISIINRFC